MPKTLPPIDTSERLAPVNALLEQFGHRPEALVPILQAVQEVFRYLPRDVLAYVARQLRLPPAKVNGVATFYAHFSLKPKGRHVVRLCDGTACHVKGSIPILEALRKHLGVTETEPTTSDMEFTVETVSCLGACGLAPVVVINEEIHGQVTPQGAVAIIDAIRTRNQNTAA